MSSLKIGFFGTPSHAADLLSMLLQQKYNVVFAVCNPDTPQGRKKILTPPPVKQVAGQHGIPVMQFASLKNAAAEINQYNADIYIIYAYGKIIPEDIFTFPRLGSVNLHGSLLPDLRGASPVQSAILQGYSKTGITLQYIVREVDAGDIITRQEIPILSDDTSETLFTKMTMAGFSLLHELLGKNPQNRFPATAQDHSQATYCQKLLTEDRKLDFNRAAAEIHNRVRTFQPAPWCYCFHRGKRLGIAKTSLTELDFSAKPGELKIVDKKQLLVKCGDSSLLLDKVQPESKKEMSAFEFINGHRIAEGEKLE